jgi:hypothetical protein
MKPFFVSPEGEPLITTETPTPRPQPEQGVNAGFTWLDAFNEASDAALKQSTKREEPTS